MAEKEQVRPLASASPNNRFRSEEDDNLSIQLKLRRRKSYAKCCGCAAAIIVIIAVAMLILAFTVFHVRGPIVRMNSVTVDPLQIGNGTIRTGSNLTLVADVSVKNPNAASFRFGNTTTAVYYGGAAVGEGMNPAGLARARRTMRMNLTVEIVRARLMAAPGLMAEVGSGSLTMDSYTKIEGRVKILNIVKKSVEVKLNCTLTYNFTSKGIERQKCIRHVSL
ncbi:Immunoglobulin-like fold containing protein [Trema orientale]|uniref:Immunoglobulin-like fold containing protein n=1 Tax=Trema orientale TaxID=63057 RepID=A0A2P5FIW3_TREOI|nr:Immunoglobulin-like fold containing protein [Trema orientale]